MLRCSNLDDLFELLEDQPYDDEIEIFLEPGLHELSKLWRIRHKLILKGEEQLSFEKEITIAPHLQLTSYHQPPTTVIHGDFTGVMIEIESSVIFKNIEVSRAKNDLLPSTNGACIGIGKNASFKATDCVFKSMQPTEEAKSENNIELDKNAYLELAHCQLISNSKAHGIKVYEQGAKSKRKYNVLLKNCQFKNLLTSFYGGEFSRCKLSYCHIENSIENAVYFFGDELEIENTQIYDSGHHAISVLSGHVSLSKIFVDQAKFSALSAYIKPKTTDLHRDEIKYQEDYQIYIDDFEGHHLGESLIFLHDATTAYAKNIKAKHVTEVACKVSGASKIYIENVEVDQCEGCSIAVIDVSEMILNRAKLTAGKWGSIYIDACSKLQVSGIDPMIATTEIDLLGCAIITCTKGDSFEELIDEVEYRRTAWHNEKWLSIIKSRSDRFGQPTKERMAILYEQFAQKYIEGENPKFPSDQFLIREYLKTWGEIGEKALYPFWIQLGSPDVVTFEQENKLLHRFELMKHTDIQSHDFINNPIEGMSLINDTIFVVTHVEIYEYTIDIENESLNFLIKYTAWPNQTLSFGKKWRMFDMISQNSKLFMIFEAKENYHSTFAVNIFDYIDHQNEIIYLDSDCRGFYPKAKKLVSYGWDSFGHPTDRVTWKTDHNRGEYPSKEPMGYAGMIPKEPWLWHYTELGGRAIKMKAFAEYHVTLNETNRHLRILNSAYAQVFELKDKAVEFWIIDRDFIICAGNHELFLIKKIRN